MSTSPPRGLVRSRPVTEESYGIPSADNGMCDWGFVVETMSTSTGYWVSTIRPDGAPHTRPTWGVWVDNAWFCGGGTETRWVRNLTSDPRLTVHTESATTVVIMEGQVTRFDAATGHDQLIERVDDAYIKKYDTPHGTPVFRVEPDRVLAWQNYPTDATRWTNRRT